MAVGERGSMCEVVEESDESCRQLLVKDVLGFKPVRNHSPEYMEQAPSREPVRRAGWMRTASGAPAARGFMG